MEHWARIDAAMKAALPYQKLVDDLWRALEDDYSTEENVIQLPDDEAPLEIPLNSEIELIDIVAIVSDLKEPFGVLRAMLAIGGSQPIPQTNMRKPGIVFATLFYNRDCDLITYDLHEEWR